MPLTTQSLDEMQYADPDHWHHVMEFLFVPALKAANYEVIRPRASGSSLIQDWIIQQLETADMVLCDLSGHNANVFFELGVRTALDKPISLVLDETTVLPFDVGGLSSYSYQSSLPHWEMASQVDKLSKHVLESRDSCNGRNPLWRKFGLTMRAMQPDVTESASEARIELLLQKVDSLRSTLEERRVVPAPNEADGGPAPGTEGLLPTVLELVGGRLVRSVSQDKDLVILTVKQPIPDSVRRRVEDYLSTHNCRLEVRAASPTSAPP